MTDFSDPQQVAQLHREQQRRLDETRERWDEIEAQDDAWWESDLASRPPNRYVRRQAEYLRKRERLNEAIKAQMQCAWPGCDRSRAYLAGFERGTLRPVFDPVYAESPLCAQHLYDAWRIARDAADADAIQRHKVSVKAALEADSEAREQRAEQRPLQPESAITGSLYYLRCDGYIKIGYASGLAARMKQYPPSAQLLAARPGNRYEEQCEHQLLRNHRAYRREWYHPTPPVLERIDQVIAQYGPLPEVAKRPIQYAEERPQPRRLRGRL